MSDVRVNRFAGVYLKAVQDLENLEDKLERAKAKRVSPRMLRFYEKLITDQQRVVEGAAALCNVEDSEDDEDLEDSNHPVFTNPDIFTSPDVSDYEGMRVQYIQGNFKFPHIHEALGFVKFADTLGLFSDVRERFYTVYLNSKNRILGYRLISAGGVDATPADMKIIFGPALALHASAIAFLHNHPTGELLFSQADKDTAMRLKDNSRMLDIRFLDFVVVGGGKFFSLHDEMPELFEGSG